MGLVSKKDTQYDGHLKVPAANTSPQDRDIWLDTGSGKLAIRVSGATVLLPLPSELGGGGLSQEQIEDFIALLIQDNSILDWTYTDNGAGAGALVAILKSGIVTNTELANVPTATIKGRVAGSTGPVTDLTVSQVKTLLALASTDISDFTTAARAAISVTDTSTLDLLYSGGAISGTVLDSPTVGGKSAAQLQTDIISAISNGAGAAYDTLKEIQDLLVADDSLQSALTSGLAIRSRFYAAAITSGSTTATVTHSFGLANIHDFNYKIFVAATGATEDYDVIGATSNTLTVTDESGANIPTGRRIFVTAGV